MIICEFLQSDPDVSPDQYCLGFISCRIGWAGRNALASLAETCRSLRMRDLAQPFRFSFLRVLLQPSRLDDTFYQRKCRNIELCQSSRIAAHVRLLSLEVDDLDETSEQMMERVQSIRGAVIKALPFFINIKIVIFKRVKFTADVLDALSSLPPITEIKLDCCVVDSGLNVEDAFKMNAGRVCFTNRSDDMMPLLPPLLFTSHLKELSLQYSRLPEIAELLHGCQKYTAPVTRLKLETNIIDRNIADPVDPSLIQQILLQFPSLTSLLVEEPQVDQNALQSLCMPADSLLHLKNLCCQARYLKFFSRLTNLL